MRNQRNMKGEEERKNKEKRSIRFLACFCQGPDAESLENLAGVSKARVRNLKVVRSSKERLASPELKQSSSVGSSTSLGKRSHRLSGIKAAIFRNMKGSGRGGKIHQDQSTSFEGRDSFAEDSVSAASPSERSRRFGSPARRTNSVHSEDSSSSASSSVSSTPEHCTSLPRPKPEMTSAEARHGMLLSSPRINVRKSQIPTKEIGDGCRKRLGPIVGLCYVLAISLGTTLMWGRVPAMLLTAIWLYFAGRTIRENPPARDRQAQMPGVDPKDYQKRITMGGFLGRSHRHRPPASRTVIDQ